MNDTNEQENKPELLVYFKKIYDRLGWILILIILCFLQNCAIMEKLKI